jgi:glycosyltransferase involved in cell wall biosynthesis/SAM-dependent methyltransferase
MTRVAFFSPLPPAKSGVADYSAALVPHLGREVDIEVFAERPRDFDAAQFDVALYQLGNNGWHEFAYEMALEQPGVVVLHEANLHHLIADLTIKRGDWDAYLREVEYDGGPKALEYASRVRALEVGPDYEGVPMLRRLLERSRAVIVHSRLMVSQLRVTGFKGPIAHIPHGAWISDVDRMGYRHRLGVDELTPLFGIFGFLKPYKRIAESLRAFRRLLRVQPRAKMILAGELHPDLPLESLLDTLDLRHAVRLLGFTPIEDFIGYVAACDVVLNLRYPTVGESSGTLLRALGLGKAVLVSDVGSFREIPNEICLKVPVDALEEDFLFEYMNLLASRPDLARGLGARAKAWVEQECSWDLVARRYASFLESVVRGCEWHDPTEAAPPRVTNHEPVSADYIIGWVSSGEDSRKYADTHLTRLRKTLDVTPHGSPSDRILEMGAYLQITPALQRRLGYGEVRGCYYGQAGQVEHHSIASLEGEQFECDIDLFDAEKDIFPYPDEYFATVLCCELIEHLAEDPMHMMAEINRILKQGGHLVLTTPNIGSLRALAAILQGYHPGFFPAYIRPVCPGETSDARHNREYTPKEVYRLLYDAGFEVARLETGPFREEPKPEHGWVVHLLERYNLPTDLRGDGIYALGRKTGPVRDRYSAWLFS